MADFIIAAIIVLIVGGAIAYIIKAKKSGAKCIGCPSGGCCSEKKNETDGYGCGCCCQSETNE